MTDSKVVMITGAASGIGAAAAELAVSRGYRVAIADIDARRAQEIAARLGETAFAVALDICDEAQWTAALDAVTAHFGRLDVLVNNAAIVHTGWARDVPLEAHRRTMETNYLGGVIGLLAALKRFRAQGAGHLVTVSSMNGFLPFPGIASYAAAKHALRAFHVALAIEERAGPVAFTLVYPGATETPMLEKEAGDDAMALAFAGTAMSPMDVAGSIIDALETRPAEVFVPEGRGDVVKALGVDPVALRASVERNELIGWEKLQARRASGRGQACRRGGPREVISLPRPDPSVSPRAAG